MGYDEKGHCPMLKNEVCSIYEHRPLTCRSYDCRIFPATGIQLSGQDKALISEQVQLWKFNVSDSREKEQLKTVKKSASFLQKNGSLFPPDELPGNPTQLAIMAIKVYDLFLEDADEHLDKMKMVEAIVEAREKFDI